MNRRQVRRSYEYTPISKLEPKPNSGIIRKPTKVSWWKLARKLLPYLAVLVIIVWVVFISSIFRIDRVDVQGPNTELSQKLSDEVNRYLSSAVAGKNWLFLNGADLKDRLQKTFTGQESVIVEKKFPNRLAVRTGEQKSGIIWQTAGHQYVISVNGQVMADTQGQNTQGLVVLTDGSSLPVNIGDRILSREFISFAIKIGDYIKANNLGPEKIYITDTTKELIVKTAAGYEIKFNTSVDPESQLRSLKAAIDLLSSQGKQVKEYIDLRVSGRAFYR
ncbi:FtsQ-type POTRA domain-containing protein [Candidatus Saccharibacteria bacterium]|nr:FtsQ-type POTRA domain-containing protein [Candidatus Saccharibacteria bacterium]